ncbi:MULTISPECIES: hypothetical protein [Photorhabdus]|uniref:Uncharacterized protein n=2 Tax=Photorhabdus TaxID=29487 RepID=A0AAW6BJP6_9GAMM|nr:MULTISPECIES: hypothetical protein [Photorhabdus]EYU16573.1 hypothetical protein BA1DRAFT_00857 [Photorhabdus aegyptia]MDB6373874.1 hypothetical protein [Photorhabdus bodei]
MLNLVTYDNLSPQTQKVARKSVTAGQKYLARKAVRVQKVKSKRNIHAAINDRYRNRRLMNSIELGRKMEAAPTTYVELLIMENLCMFSPEGDHFLFSEHKYISQL